MIKSMFYLTQDEKVTKEVEMDQVGSLLATGKGLLWIDMEGTSSQDAQFLIDTLRLHPLAVADCVSEHIHPPKIDQFVDNLFMILHGINYQTDSDLVETMELALFLGKNYVVTNHDLPCYGINAIRHMIEEDNRPMKRGADFLAYAILDALVDNVMPTIDRMSDVAEIIEEEVIHHPHQSVLEGIMKLKRSSLKVHRIMTPQREVFNRLSRGEFSIIHTNAEIFYRNIYDHIIRIDDLNRTILDRTDNALATYLSSVANRQNETMRVLSIVATIFLPLTLVASIYGMNFDYMPELSWRWGYFTVLGAIGLVALIVLWRFWASNWLAWGRRKMTWVRPFMVEGKKLRGYIVPRKKRQHQDPSKS